MRRLETIPPEPPSLSSEKTLKERAAAQAWFADEAHLNLPFEKPGFDAYRGDDVKRTLEEAFHHKCAYCESSYGPVMPLDVEHYRPKAKVTLPTVVDGVTKGCLLYTSPSPRDRTRSRMPSSA